MKFKRNDTITQGKKTYTVTDFLGEGGQGEVYLVECEGSEYALKIYKYRVSADFRYNLKNNIAKGAPSSEFLWPIELLDFDDVTGLDFELFSAGLNDCVHNRFS